MINDLEIVQWDYLLDPAFQLVNTAGKPLTNGWIEVYIHGTRDKYYCASDFNGTLHPFQIPLDSLGSNIVLASPANAYDVYVYNVYGSLVMSRYNVKPGSGSGSGVIPADASYGIFGTNELSMNNTSNTGFQFTAKDIGGDDITFHEITYPYGRIDCKEGVYFYSATIEVSNTETSNESVKFQVLAGKNPNQSVYWLDFDNTYLHKQLYTICGIANFVNEDTFRINVSPYQLTNGVKASASQVAIHKLSTVVEGEGGGGGHEYGAGWGILINNDEISVDPSIIPTIEYVDASVSAVSSTLISTIESVSGNLQDQIDNIPAQVQSDWNQTDDTQVDYIKNKPDLTVYATHDEVCAVSSVLQNEIDNIDMSEYVTHTELNETVTAVSSVLENEIQIVSAAIPNVSDFVTHDEVSAVSSNLVEYVDNSINNVSGDLVEYIDESVNNVSGDLIEYVDNSVNTASGNLVQYIDDSITEVNETINNVSGDLVEYIDNSVGAVSGDIIEYVDNTVNNVSGVLESEIQIVSGAIPVVTGYATKDEVNTVSSTIINTLEVVSGAIQDTIESVSGNLQEQIDNIPEQVNADWNAVSGKAEILNKPDLDIYATHDEVSDVSGTIIEYIDDSIDVVNNNVTAVSSVLNDKIDAVSAAVPDAQIQSDWNQTDNTKKDYIKNKPDLSHFVTDDELVDAVTSVSAVLETDIQVVSGALDELSATVASASGIEYGQFYSTGITTTPATMARVKGNILVDNGRIQLKKGSSYHVTVRGRYNQTTAANTNIAVGYIEYVSNNTINVNVDKTVTDSQYFEISYDLFNLSNNVDYLVWFTGTDGGTINDLWIEVHSLAGIGNGSGGGTGPGVEYTAGYGIQILNNVISVSGIAPQVQSDWNATSGMAQILNKPEEQKLVPGSNITIAVSGVSAVISSVQSEGPQVQADWEAVSGASQILNRPDEYGLVAGDNIEISVSGNNIVIDSTAGGDVTHADLEAVSGALETDIMSVSGAVSGINDPNIFYAIYGTTTYADTLVAYNAGKKIFMKDDAVVIPCTNKGGSPDEFRFNGIREMWRQGGPTLNYYRLSSRDGWYRRTDFNLQANWNQTDNYYPDYIKNKPDLSVYATNSNLSSVSGTLHAEIQSVSSAIPEEMSLVAGDNIEIQVSGASAIISSTATGDVTQADLEAVSGQLETEIQIVSAAIPDVSNLATEAELQIVSAAIPAELTGASGVKIEDDVASLDDPIFVKAGSGITITQDGDDIVISSTVTATPQVNADWTAVSGAAEILNKPNEYNLIAGTNVVITKEGNDVTISARGGGGGGSSYIAGTGINIDANDVISVSGVAMASAIDVVSGKLPTTELGKFTIQNNVTGGPIEVICPTDQGFPIETVILDNTAVSGSSGSGTSSVYIVYKSPGYDNDYYTEEGAAILHIPEAVTGLYSLQLIYASNSNPASYNGPAFTNPSYIYGDSTGGRYVLDAGDYDVNVIANQTSQGGGYGKYITLYAAGPGPDVEALLKSSFSLAVRHPELGLTVNLDRYTLGNTSTTTSTSGLTQATIYTDPVTKKQSVYLPNYMPNNWISRIAQYMQYGSNRNRPDSYYTSKQYIAYKETTSNHYLYAFCTDNDVINNKMTFISYNESGEAIEKWTLDYSTYSSNVWTTTSISPDMSEYISYSASGVYLPNSKFEIDTNGQAYKVLTAGSETDYNNYYDGFLYYGYYSRLPDRTNVMKAGTYRITATNDNIKSFVIQSSGSFSAYNGLVLPVIDNHVDLIITQDVQITTSNDSLYIRGYTNSNGTGSWVQINSTNDATVKYIVSAVKEEYITESAIPEEINLIPGSGITIEVSGASAVISSTGGGGGSSYTAGEGIDITNNTISLETPIEVVATSEAATGTNILYIVTGQ